MEIKNVFISFSSKQQNEATRICNLIEANGISCFISSRDLIAGEEYAKQLIDNISACDSVVLVLTNDSNNSPHVLREIEYAVSHNIPIIVYVQEECTLSKSMEYFLMTHQWLLPSADQDNKLIESVKHILNKSSVEPSIKNVPQEYSGNKSQNNKESKSKSKNSKGLIIALTVVMLLLLVVIILLVVTPLFKTSESYDSDGNTSKIAKDDDNDKDRDSDSEDKDKKKKDSSYELGDTVSFGSYYGEPIEWRVIDIDNDNGKVLLISKYILTMKVYDAAEGGKLNRYDGVDYWSYENSNVDDEELLIKIRGNNDWSQSNIRTWLNSSSEVVAYADQAPDRKAVEYNFYSNESGFLYGFSEEERDAIIPTTIHSPANTFSEDAKNGQVKTTDYVFLLSSDELQLLNNAGISIYASPTESCIENDNNKEGYASFKSIADIDEYYWWLRDNDGKAINKAYIVNTPYEPDTDITSYSVGSTSFGVRPAMWVDADSSYIKQ